MQNIDLLIRPRWLAPVVPAGLTLVDHAVAVDQGRIVAVLPESEALQRFAPRSERILDRHLLIPGLVNLHTHAAMSLLRGLADDLPLMDWLRDHIWPAEAKHVSAQFVYDGTRLACAEMLRGGITCFNDMYFYPEATAEAAVRAGIRASIGLIALDLPTPYASDADDYLHKGLQARDQFSSEPLLSFTLAPHAPYTVSDKTFGKILTYAEQLELPIHLHVQETLDEIAQSLQQHHQRPIQRLHHLGLLGSNLIAVHAVHLQEDEMSLLASQGCHVAHCPVSNLKLASGIAPIQKLREHGVNIGLGSDSAASNNRLDLFQEMRFAALLAKGASGNAAALPAFDALRMATLDGARALGLDERIGSLSPGKAADIVAVDLGSLEMQPCYDIVSHLIYVAGREQVTHVWVDGKLRVENRTLLTLDEKQLASQARRWKERIGNPSQ